jgi:CcmD family protein
MEFREAVPFVVAVYMGIWVVLFVFVVLLHSRLSRLLEEVKVLTRVVEKQTGKGAVETSRTEQSVPEAEKAEA